LRLAIGESKSEGDEGDGDNGREHDLNEMERSQAPTGKVPFLLQILYINLLIPNVCLHFFLKSHCCIRGRGCHDNHKNL
jgi:hypothetical protein